MRHSSNVRGNFSWSRAPGLGFGPFLMSPWRMVAVSLLCMLCGCVLPISRGECGETAWPDGDRYAETAWEIVYTVDFYQTLQVAKQPERFREHDSSWLVGRHPSELKVGLMFTTGAVVHWAVTDQLVRHRAPGWLRAMWQATSIGYEASTVRANFRVGVR